MEMREKGERGKNKKHGRIPFPGTLSRIGFGGRHNEHPPLSDFKLRSVRIFRVDKALVSSLFITLDRVFELGSTVISEVSQAGMNAERFAIITGFRSETVQSRQDR